MDDVINNPPFPPANEFAARTITITMPDSESAYIVLRVAFNEVAGKMASTNNPNCYINYATAIKASMDKGNYIF